MSLIIIIIKFLFISAPYACLVPRPDEGVGSIELELQTVMSLCVGARN